MSGDLDFYLILCVREMEEVLFRLQRQRGRALTLLLTCLDTAQIPCWPTSTAGQVTLRIRKRVGLGILEVWATIWGLTKYMTHKIKQTANCKKIKVK